MVKWDLLKKLMDCFPGSIINQKEEFIAHIRANEYFSLRNCETEFDLKCKVLEWFSRGVYKTEPYRRKDENARFHKFMLHGINEFLGTDFDSEDMEEIYTYLGNACNHKRTIQFVKSGYDMQALKQIGE